MDKKTYNLLVEPEGYNYNNLLDYALTKCKFFLLITDKNNKQLSATGKGVLEQLAPFLNRLEMKSEWPGTVLYGAKALVYTYYYVRESAEILKRSASRLYQWQRPDLPDDLCLLRSDESPWLVTIAHEDDSYFELTEEELSELLKAIPAYSSMILIASE